MTLQQSNYIKVVAIITMLIDHIGAILLPDVIIFRIIGRIAFPLFAYQLCIGYEHTKDLKKYIFKLLNLGLIIQLFFTLCVYVFGFSFKIYQLNILFTLALGLIAIYCYDKKRYFLLFIIALVLNLNLEYGSYGIALILLFHITSKYKFNYIVLSILLLNLSYCITGSPIQLFSLFSLLFIFKPKDLKFNIPKKLFYWFYPVHLTILYFINVVIKNM